MCAETLEGQDLERDASGAILCQRTYARRPETGTTSLKRQISDEVWHRMGRQAAAAGHTLTRVAVADGAKDNGSFPEQFSPDIMLLDDWHRVQHLGTAAFGAGSKSGRVGVETQKERWPGEVGGAGRVIDALRDLLRKQTEGSPASDAIRSVIGPMVMISLGRNNRTRMGSRAARDAGVPIAGGSVEAANKTLVGVRMKRSGASWGRAGGTGVLAFRTVRKSDRFDAAWARMAATWRSPEVINWANDNRFRLARVA